MSHRFTPRRRRAKAIGVAILTAEQAQAEHARCDCPLYGDPTAFTPLYVKLHRPACPVLIVLKGQN
jgi:hypothetical protein